MQANLRLSIFKLLSSSYFHLDLCLIYLYKIIILVKLFFNLGMHKYYPPKKRVKRKKCFMVTHSHAFFLFLQEWCRQKCCMTRSKMPQTDQKSVLRYLSRVTLLHCRISEMWTHLTLLGHLKVWPSSYLPGMFYVCLNLVWALVFASKAGSHFSYRDCC